MLSVLKSFLFKNSSTSQTIAKNTVWLAIGQLLSRAIRAIIVIYAARVLGVASWGAFSYALGIAAFLTIFSDIGINSLITKETSRHPDAKSKYLSTAFFIKLILLFIVTLGVIIIFPHLSNIPEATAIMPIIILVFAFDTMRDLGSSLSRALQQMEIEAIINIFTNAAITILGFVALYIRPTSLYLSFAYAAGSGLGMLAIFYTLRQHFSHILKHFTVPLVKQIIVTAWPFGLMGMMGAIMLNTDIIMLGVMRSPEEVGFYSAAQKLILLAYVFPGLLASSTFPVISKFSKSNSVEAKKILEKSVALILLIAAPLSIAGFLFAKPILALLFGAAYLPAANTFKILSLTLLIVYPGTLIGNALFAYDEQKYFLKFVTISTIANAVFNYILIIPYGIEGAAASTILTQLISNALAWRKIKKVMGLRLGAGFKMLLE